MKTRFLSRAAAFAVWLACSLTAQVVFYPQPTRFSGQKTAIGSAPNLIEGREFWNPQGVALDTTVDPPRIYVADTFNNRVLGWRDAYNFSNGAKADIVIGQRGDFETSYVLGPAAGFSSGLTLPTSVAVDSRNGNLFVYDVGNNRVVRYRTPFADPDPVKVADLVIGQPTLSGRTANAVFPGESERIHARNLATTTSSKVLFAGMALDKENNLWITDPANNRVLRYPAAAIGDEARLGQVAADLVLGQTSFNTNAAAPRTGANYLLNKDQMNEPAAIGVDLHGNVFVSDLLNTGRVLVYAAPVLSGKPAARLLGIPVVATGSQIPAVNEVGLAESRGIYIAGNIPFIVDSLHSRILRYAPFDQWPPENRTSTLIDAISPKATAYIGQDSLLEGLPNRRLTAEAGNSSVAYPSAIVMAPNGEFFVADTGNNRISVFNDLRTGPLTSAAGSYTIRRVLGQDTLFGSAVNLIEGRELSAFAFLFATTGVVNALVGVDVAVDYSGDPPRMYVLDGGNSRILGYSDARRAKPGDRADLVIGQVDFYRALVNSPGNDTLNPTRTGLNYPTAIVVDSQGNLWVADRGNGRVLRFPRPFDRAGEPQRADLVIGQSAFDSPSVREPGARTLGSPYSIAFTVEGDLLVSDSAHHRVLFYRRPFSNGMAASLVLGQADFNAGAAGVSTAQFNSPRGIALDSDDRLYVCDFTNKRMQIFERVQGAANGAAASATVGLAGGPMSIAISQTSGDIWVSEYNNNRVLRFPAFNQLILNPNTAIGVIPNVPAGQQPPAGAPSGPVAVRLDQQENVYIGDLRHRIGLYVPIAKDLNNSASRFMRYAPGMITDFFLQDRAPAVVEQGVVNGNPSWPKSLADVEVLVGGIAAPLYYVFPRQIAFQIPAAVPPSGVAEIVVQRASTGQPLAAASVRMETASPGFFTLNQQGTGQVAAVNEDGSINSSASDPTGNPRTGPIDRGKFISFYLTGQGLISGMPADGEPAAGLIPTPGDAGLRVIIGTAEAEVQYSGLAPGYVGLWQINARVPPNTAPLPNVAVVIQYRSVISNQNPLTGARVTTSIAVK